MGGIYLHIPYCRTKCLYCDFYSGGIRIAQWTAYVDCLINEMTSRREELKETPETLYIGGGTPSLIPLRELTRLMSKLKDILNVSEWEEFTLEVNPEDVNEDNVKKWRNSGVNRISIGIQSLINKELKVIGRRHTSQDAERAIKLLKSEFDNFSVDIINGLPYQTTDSYLYTLNKIIDFDPSHISTYTLMLEPGTALTRLSEEQRILLPREEETLKMMKDTTDLLEMAGYSRYEISNFSKPGFESIHNNNYWTGKPYIGLGPSAHSYDGEKTRRANPNDIKGYLKRFMTIQGNPFYSEEHLTEDESREEMIMLRLRTKRGLDPEEFEKRFGQDAKKDLFQKSRNFILHGFMKEEKNRLAFTNEGFMVSDFILSSII